MTPAIATPPYNPQLHMAALRAEARTQLGPQVSDPQFIEWLAERLYTTRGMLVAEKELLEASNRLLMAAEARADSRHRSAGPAAA